MDKTAETDALLVRIEKLAATNPETIRAVNAFLDLLQEQPQHVEPDGTGQRDDWLPILGRSAAGIVFFWDDLPQGFGKSPADRLSELIEVYLRAETAGELPASLEPTDGPPAPPLPEDVSLIQVNVPGDAEVSEFLNCPAVRKRYPDAFALRIDGDSMKPQLLHGDLVIVSPTVPAADGHPAVVQFRGQVGVTCKIYRRQGDDVHLVPANKDFRPKRHKTSEILWALRVLFRVRVGGPEGIVE